MYLIYYSLDIINYIRYYSTHVHRTHTQQKLTSRRPPPRVLPRRRQGQETNPRQPVQVAQRARRGIPHPAQGRHRTSLPRRRLPHPSLPAPSATSPPCWDVPAAWASRSCWIAVPPATGFCPWQREPWPPMSSLPTPLQAEAFRLLDVGP